MDFHSPFVCYEYEVYPPSLCFHGGFYSLKTADNRSEIVAYTVDHGMGYRIYKASPLFLEKNADMLPVWDVHEWYFKKDMAVWLESVIFYSFMRCSLAGMACVPKPKSYVS